MAMNHSKMPEWMDEFFAGIDMGSTPVVVAETDTHAILRIPGSSYWGGILNPRCYAATHWMLVRKMGRHSAYDLEKGGHYEYVELQNGGRLAKAKLEVWKKWMVDASKKGLTWIRKVRKL